MIKPSSPTPLHLKETKFSILDQIIPPTYTPVIFFYPHLLNSDTTDHHPHHHHQTRISQLLKESLGKTLTIFYPLAGQIQENSSIDCNDEGVHFIEARVNSPLSDIIIVTQDQYNIEQLNKLLPVQPSGYSTTSSKSQTVSAVQINFFACGGLAIAICVSHKVADGYSRMAFIQSWAATCRGGTNVIQPRFDLASFFPPLELLNQYGTAENSTDEAVVTKRFVFDKEKIASLKAEIARSQLKEDATRVEAVSAFIWKQFIDIAKKKNPSLETFAAHHSVDSRPRVSPHIIPEQVFGNLSLISPTMCSTSDDEHGQMHYLAHRLHRGIKKINDDYIRQVQLDSGHYLRELQKHYEHAKEGKSLCCLTSWCRFPLYEIDFCWGKPNRVCTVMPQRNLVVLMSTPSGEGIEAWVNLHEDEMAMFERLFMLM